MVCQGLKTKTSSEYYLYLALSPSLSFSFSQPLRNAKHFAAALGSGFVNDERQEGAKKQKQLTSLLYFNPTW